MRFYQRQHQFYCGIDLHARTMCVCIIYATGQVLVNDDGPCDPQRFLRLIEPYRQDLVVACECTFHWYWRTCAPSSRSRSCSAMRCT